MRKVIFVIGLLGLFIVSHCQNVKQEGYFDTLGRKQGYFEFPNVFNLIQNEHIIRAVECKEFGYYKDNKRIGIWDVKDLHDSLVGQIVYNDENNRKIEFHFLNNKLITVIIYGESYLNSLSKYGASTGETEIMEIQSYYNGCLIKRTKFSIPAFDNNKGYKYYYKW
jgi:hypothetical protein